MKYLFRALLPILTALPSVADNKPCAISVASIKGAWTHVGPAGFFDAMDFSIEDGHRVFNSWLHQRPEISGGTWLTPWPTVAT